MAESIFEHRSYLLTRTCMFIFGHSVTSTRGHTVTSGTSQQNLVPRPSYVWHVMSSTLIGQMARHVLLSAQVGLPFLLLTSDYVDLLSEATA